jgi:hypothetical protein
LSRRRELKTVLAAQRRPRSWGTPASSPTPCTCELVLPLADAHKRSLCLFWWIRSTVLPMVYMVRWSRPSRNVNTSWNRSSVPRTGPIMIYESERRIRWTDHRFRRSCEKKRLGSY